MVLLSMNLVEKKYLKRATADLDSMDASSSELVEFVGNRDAGPAIQKLLPGKKSMLTNLAKLLGQLWGKVNWILLNDGMNSS